MGALRTVGDSKSSQYSVDPHSISTASGNILQESREGITEKPSANKINKELLKNWIVSSLISSNALSKFPAELINLIEMYAHDPFGLFFKRLLDRYGEPLSKAAFLESSAFHSVHNRDELFYLLFGRFSEQLDFKKTGHLMEFKPVKFVRLLIDYIIQQGDISAYSIPVANDAKEVRSYDQAAATLREEIFNVSDNFDLANELRDLLREAERNNDAKLDLMAASCLREGRPIFFYPQGLTRRRGYQKLIGCHITPSACAAHEMLTTYGLSLYYTIKQFQAPMLFQVAHLLNEWRRNYYEVYLVDNRVVITSALDPRSIYINFSDFIIGIPLLMNDEITKIRDLFSLMFAGSFLVKHSVSAFLRSTCRATIGPVKRYLQCELTANKRIAANALTLISFTSFNLRLYNLLEQLSLPYSSKYLSFISGLAHIHYMELGSLQFIHELNQRDDTTLATSNRFGWEMLSVMLTFTLPLLLSLGFGAEESLLWQVLMGFAGSIELMVEFASVRAVRNACDRLEPPLLPELPSIRLSTHRNALHSSRLPRPMMQTEDFSAESRETLGMPQPQNVRKW